MTQTKNITVEVLQQTDEKGELEVFTWALLYKRTTDDTAHLKDNGLPKVGEKIVAGKVIVGLIGKSSTYDEEQLPNCLERHALTQEELIAKYGYMFTDKSLVAQNEHEGVVVEAYFEEIDGIRKRAVVVIDTSKNCHE